MVDLDYTIGGKKVGGEIGSGSGGSGSTPIPSASTSEKGIVQLASSSEIITATNTTKAITAADAKTIINQSLKVGLQPATDIYVDPVSGLDLPSTPGTVNQPFKTLGYALASANPLLKTNIYLSAGTYPTIEGSDGFTVNGFLDISIRPKAGVADGAAKILIKPGKEIPSFPSGALARSSFGIQIVNCGEVKIFGLEFLNDPSIPANEQLIQLVVHRNGSTGYVEVSNCIFNCPPGILASSRNGISASHCHLTMAGQTTVRGAADGVMTFLRSADNATVLMFSNIVFENSPAFAGSFLLCEYNSTIAVSAKTMTGAATGRSFVSRFDSRVYAISGTFPFPNTLTAGTHDSLQSVSKSTATLDFPAVAANASASLSMSVPGVAIGDPIALGTPVPPAGITFNATVTAANSVTITAFNRSASSVDVPAGAFTVIALKA